MSKMSKKEKGFKKVYEAGDVVKGSVSGQASKDDVVILERSVLEGKKEPAPIPLGETKITENGDYDVSKFATAKVDVAGMKPTGKLDIVENGDYDVADRASVGVNVPQGVFPEGVKEIRNNGEFDVMNFERVSVDVPGATTKELFDVTANGTYDIAEYANVKVEVPNPSVGVLDIVANGEYDVAEKAGVNVNVPIPEGYIKPTGSTYVSKWDLSREEYTTIDVTNYQTVEIPGVKELCDDTRYLQDSDLYDSYGHYNPSVVIAGYNQVDVSNLSSGGVQLDTIYSGYYYCEYSADVRYESDFKHIDTPPQPLPIDGKSAKLIVNKSSYDGEYSYYAGYHPDNNFAVVSIDDICNLAVDESAEFTVYIDSDRTFKLTRIN